MQAAKFRKRLPADAARTIETVAQDTVCFIWFDVPREERDAVRMERMVDTDSPFLPKQLLPILLESTGKNRPHMETEKARESRSLAAQQSEKKQ